MAELILFVVAERIIGTLNSLAAKEIGLPWGVKDEVKSLMSTVSPIKAVLLDAEKQDAAGNYAVKDWLKKLEKAMYDADDLLDEVSTEVLRREIMTRDKKAKKVRIFFSESNQLAFRCKIAHKIKAMTQRLAAIDAERLFHLEGRQVEETRVRIRERDNTHSFVREEKIIGREADKKAVIHFLMDSNVEENVSVLPIVGIGGLGKTTLARLVFNDVQIEKHFDLKMWVLVSDVFDVKNIVSGILESATKKKSKAGEMDTLVYYLSKEIEGKKYFLVLDDVWNENGAKWSSLRDVLMGGARGSRILVTTRTEIAAETIRQESVAGIIGTVKSYPLKGLDEDASWSLFKQKAFEEGQEPKNSSIVALGKEIVKTCSGVPPALCTIGSLLRFKNSEAEWLPFKEKELSKISHNNILRTLKLSYDNLPSHLKLCFAYCSLFPKDCEIDRSTLIKLWIAQGFIQSSDDQNQCLEDTGNKYFMDLLLRSFFQEATKVDEFGNIILFKMDGLMHDLAKSVAGSSIVTLDHGKKDFDEKTRHVIVGNDVKISPTSLYKASRIRTLLFLGHYFEPKIFSSSKFLRVLNVHCKDLDPIPSSIGRLKYLKYLDLSGNNGIKKLPDSISRLQNLQTLRLSKCSSLKELPSGITRLVNLRHLEIDGCRALTCMPRGLGQLTNLQTLSRFVVHRDGGKLNELSQLRELRGKLQIFNLRDLKDAQSECEGAKLEGKENLHALHLFWDTQGDSNDSDSAKDEASLKGFQPHQNLKQLSLLYYRSSQFPNGLFPLNNLVRFELWLCKNCQSLPQLSQLRFLQYLSLGCLYAMEYISDSDELSSSSLMEVDFFPSLREIRLCGCPKLKGWWSRHSSAEANSDSHHLRPSFSNLSTLQISNCPMLTSMPMFPCLEEKLDLAYASSKPLQQTMMMNMAASSSSTPLSKLKYIKMNFIEDLETLPLQNLTSLESLTISNCSRLKSISPDEDGMQRQCLTGLLSLHISRLPKLLSLPSMLQHATTLQTLEISYCECLTAIPEWIHYCNSLQVLDIRHCMSLASLPEGMRRLKSLQRLTIVDSPILLQRCEKGIGEDWVKIAKIPELDLRYPL